MNQVALITGGTAGIGLQTAMLLRAAGWRVAVCGRDAQRVREAGELLRAAEQISGARAASADSRGEDGVMAVRCDVARAQDCRAMVDEILTKWGRVDALVHSAGVAPRLPIAEHDDETIGKVFETNTLSALRLVRALWPGFVRSKAGVVVLVSSMASREPYSGFFAYAASKAALNLAAKVIAQEGAAFGVRGFAVAPGAVETAMLRAIADESQVPRDNALAPDAVARVIVQCVSGERDSENGETLFLPSP